MSNRRCASSLGSITSPSSKARRPLSRFERLQRRNSRSQDSSAHERPRLRLDRECTASTPTARTATERTGIRRSRECHGTGVSSPIDGSASRRPVRRPPRSSASSLAPTGAPRECMRRCGGHVRSKWRTPAQTDASFQPLISSRNGLCRCQSAFNRLWDCSCHNMPGACILCIVQRVRK